MKRAFATGIWRLGIATALAGGLSLALFPSCARSSGRVGASSAAITTHADNPFAGAIGYVNPGYQAEVQTYAAQQTDATSKAKVMTVSGGGGDVTDCSQWGTFQVGGGEYIIQQNEWSGDFGSSPRACVNRTSREAPRILHAALATAASFDFSREMSR